MEYIIVKKVLSCEGCPALCCVVGGEVEVTNREIYRISKYLNIDPMLYFENNLIIKSIGNVCPFLDKNNYCTIYNIRPRVCREYDCNYDKPLLNLKLSLGY